jgi:FkbM family methyltransferase
MIDYVPFNQLEFNRWIQDNGDNTLRFDYPLVPNSVVVDAGGYVGQWAFDINSRFRSIVFVLEPLQDLYEVIEDRFANNERVIPLNYAIASKTGEVEISDNTDGSSLYDSTTEATRTILCKDVKEFIEENNINTIDLFKINIEGAEYDLLERVIELGLPSKVKNFQIQFHRFIPDCEARRNNIIEQLSKTHECTWNYDWIWENWKLKD